MTQQSAEQQIQALQEEVRNLKVRQFDTQAALTEERKSFGQFVGILAQLLDFAQENASSLQNYLDEISVLTGKVEPVDTAEPAADGVEAE